MVRTQAAMLALVLTLTATGAWWPRTPRESKESIPWNRRPLDPVQVEEETERLQDQRQMRERFVGFSEELIAALIARRMGLIEARERLLFYCLGQYPQHLERVGMFEEGASLREKLARNLLRELQVMERIRRHRGVDFRSLTYQYEQELRESLIAQAR